MVNSAYLILRAFSERNRKRLKEYAFWPALNEKQSTTIQGCCMIVANPTVFCRSSCSCEALEMCSKEELVDDIRRFLEHRRGKVLLPSSFPEAVLNGRQLDIEGMYRIVCRRGGFAADTTMNWAGKVG